MSFDSGLRQPHTIGLSFIYAIAADDFSPAWHLMDDNLKLVYAQTWAYNCDQPDDVQVIVQGPDDSALWQSFGSEVLGGLQEQFQVSIGLHSIGHLGVMTAPRPVGVELEEVLLVDDREAGPNSRLVRDGPMFADRLTVRCDGNGCSVAGIKGVVPQPGWPPTQPRLDDTGWSRP